MKNLTLEKIASICGGTYVGREEDRKKEIAGAVTDSRQIQEGFLFLPVKGERVDGHDFIPQVFAQGALAALSEKPLEVCAGPYIQVPSCLAALKEIAAYYRSILPIPVVGVTGSVGKTSTKEMIAAVLSEKYKVLKTAGNYNNEIGLPLTILRIRQEHQVAVVEMGISDFGEMHRLGAIAKPDLMVITNIGECHLENLKDRDGVLAAKTEVFAHLKEGAAVFLNGDDDKLITITEAAGAAPVFYGRQKHAIFMDKAEDLGLKGSAAMLHTPAGEVAVNIPIPGEHHLYNAMAAAGVGLKLGLSLEEIRRGLAKAKAMDGRSNLIETGGMMVIDDCYNANPVSMAAAIDMLKKGPGRKIAVLGDMGELGQEEKKLHCQVGEYAAWADIHYLFCVGTLAKEMCRGAKAALGQRKDAPLQVFYYETKEEMLLHLLALAQKGDTILVKASHFMEFQKVVEGLKSL